MRTRFFVAWLMLCCALSSGRSESAADTPEQLAPPEPAVCLGYNPQLENWGFVGTELNILELDSSNRKEQMCPAGYALLNVRRAAGRQRAGKKIPLIGNCCPLPKGVLLARHVFAPESCPAGHVATGVSPNLHGVKLPEACAENTKECRQWMINLTYEMRCTAIDTRRYMLGEPAPGMNWGKLQHFSNTAERWTTLARMPVAMRYGMGRIRRFGWHVGGCVGYPWGSLFVRKTGKSCDDFYFSPLLYRGLPGDPPRSTPVAMFPQCSSISDRYEPDGRCIP